MRYKINVTKNDISLSCHSNSTSFWNVSNSNGNLTAGSGIFSLKFTISCVVSSSSAHSVFVFVLGVYEEIFSTGNDTSYKVNVVSNKITSQYKNNERERTLGMTIFSSSCEKMSTLTLSLDCLSVRTDGKPKSSIIFWKLMESRHFSDSTRSVDVLLAELKSTAVDKPGAWDNKSVPQVEINAQSYRKRSRLV